MNVYEIITDRILNSLANGVIPWRKPWHTERPKNLISGKDYRGVNVLLLGSAPYESPWWLTFNQARTLGGTVKKGERGTPVIFWKVYGKETEDGGADKDRRFVLRYFTAFNVAQCEGIEAPPAISRPFNPIEECERIVSGFEGRPSIEHGGSLAFYAPSSDRIQIPARETFSSAPEYYSTLFHELVHSTGAASRLDRKAVADPNSFASHEYSFEELVAECGSAFLCAEAGISASTLENSAAYIASWAKKLRSEPKWIVNASAQAAKASDLILGKVAKQTSDADTAVAA
jgi:antirestriction protein ArdC